MIKKIFAMLLFSSIHNISYAETHDTKPDIVFIHGWLGWGEGKLLGIRGWGGLFFPSSYFTRNLITP